MDTQSDSGTLKIGLDRFYKQWIIANGLAEGVGLSAAFFVGYIFTPINASISAFSIVSLTLLVVIIGALFEGAIVGIAQSIPLKSINAGVSKKSWIIATMIGVELAWLAGTVPAIALSLFTTPASQLALSDTLLPLQYFFAVVSGLVIGSLLGVPQWLLLRKHFNKTGRWVSANALAWAAGMPLIFIGMEFIPWSGSWLSISVALILVCITAGAVVGTIHGWFLVKILQSSGAKYEYNEESSPPGMKTIK